MKTTGRRRAGLVLAALGATLAVPALAQAAAPKWAVVNAAGGLVRGSGAVSSVNLGTGTYQVIFNSNMTGCSYIATAGDPGAGAVAGPITVSVASRAGNVNGVYLETHDQTSGALSNQPFQLVTHCPTKDRFAVVADNGALARGSGVVSTANLGVGSYEVIFNKNVNKCAFTASIGTTSTGAVASPGVVTVAGRAGNKAGVFVRIVDRLGTAVNQPFHLSATCGKKNLTAVVEGTGALARGTHVTSAALLGTGTYQVIFDRTVSGCAYSATVGTTTNGGSIGPPPVVVTTATRAGNANGVFIFIHQANGTTLSDPYHLAVFC